MIPGLANRRRFSELSEQEILALAISSEEDDARIYRTYADRLRKDYPASAAIFDAMAKEEDTHRHWLIERHRARFGDTIPLIRREHVAGFYARRPVWLVENLTLDRIRGEAEAIHAALASAYKAEPFVVVLPLGEAPATRHVRGSNFVHLGVIADRRPGRAMVFSTLDNLAKGSSGQALQNANLMLGLPETAGLMAAPLFP